MAAFWIIRVICLVLVILLSCAIAVSSGLFISKFVSFNVPGLLSESMPAWVYLSIVVAGLSVLLIVPMLIIDFVRRGAVTSWVITELIVFSILSIVYLADAADTTADFKSALSFLSIYRLPKTCGGLDRFITGLEELAIEDPVQYGALLDLDLSTFGTLCHIHEAVEALAFLNWIILMGYAITLLIFALVARSRGHPVIWSSTVRDTRFLARPEQEAYLREDIEVPMGAMQQNYYASDPSLKMETSTLAPENSMHAQNVHQ